MLKPITKNLKRKDANEIFKFVEFLNGRKETAHFCRLHFCAELKGHDYWNREVRIDGYYIRKRIWIPYKKKRLKKILLAIAHEYKHFLQEVEPKHFLVEEDCSKFSLPVLCRMMSSVFVRSEFQADMWAGKVVKQFLQK